MSDKRHNKETKEKMRRARISFLENGGMAPFLGRKHTLEAKKKMSQNHASRGMTGHKHSIDSKLKMSLNKKGKNSGSDNHRWIEDRTKLSRINKQGERRTSAYFEWRKRVWLRDNFACKIANPDCDGRIEAHHILGWGDYPELRYQINNGITLCHAHHPRRRAEEKRLSPYFMELVSASSKTF